MPRVSWDGAPGMMVRVLIALPMLLFLCESPEDRTAREIREAERAVREEVAERMAERRAEDRRVRRQYDALVEECFRRGHEWCQIFGREGGG